MTYCIAVSTHAGLVFCSDSRTNAGPDMLSTYSKMHIFTPAPDRFFCLLTAGSLATTQQIITSINQEMNDVNVENLVNCGSLVEAARYVARISQQEQIKARKDFGSSGIDTSVSLIFGGQVQGGAHGIFLLYPAGNFIAESDEAPFLQIGESKYGKPILDRILKRDTSLEDAARCTIVSMDSTITSNATVGPPIEILVYQTNGFSAGNYIKLGQDDDYLREIKRCWSQALTTAFQSLPPFGWESRGRQNDPANSQ